MGVTKYWHCLSFYYIVQAQNPSLILLLEKKLSACIIAGDILSVSVSHLYYNVGDYYQYFPFSSKKIVSCYLQLNFIHYYEHIQDFSIMI